MTPAKNFLQSILDEPEDDAVRLIFADWLTDQGDPRGAFIRVQFALAELPNDHPSRPELEECEKTLLQRHRREWAGPVASWVSRCEFRKGFVERIILPAVQFVAHAERLFGAAPIRCVRLTE